MLAEVVGCAPSLDCLQKFAKPSLPNVPQNESGYFKKALIFAVS